MKRIKPSWFGLLLAILFTTACGGGGGGGDGAVALSGTGTLKDPYVLQVDQSYDITVMGHKLLCGQTFNLNCSNFDKDYVSVKFTVPAYGKYRLSVTGVEAGKDLVLFVFMSDSPNSTVITYVGTVDNNGKGVGETTEGEADAGYDVYFFFQMWGGANTVHVKMEKI